jgi:hypothetical protein
LGDLLLRDGTVSHVVTLQGTGAVLVCQTAYRLRPFWLFFGWKSR